MIGVHVQWFVLAFLLFNTVRETTSTDFPESEVITRAEHYAYAKILADFPVTADPFSLGNITLALTDSKFELYNVLISGMSNCKVVYTSVDGTDMTFEMRWLCPQLVLNADFVGEGTMGGIACDGQGVTQIVSDYKLVIWKGDFTVFTSDVDQKQYHYATKYTVDVVYIEKMSYVITSMNDQSQAVVDELNKYLSENWKEVTTYTEPTFIEVFIKKAVEYYNEVLKTKMSLDDLLSFGDMVYGSL